MTGEVPPPGSAGTAIPAGFPADASPELSQALPTLGWREVAALPEWGIPALRVKLDTGAKTSAVHAVDVHEAGSSPSSDGGPPLRLLGFSIPLGRDPDAELVEVVAPVVAYRSIRDTRARPERRPVVQTRLVCGSVLDCPVELALTDRGGMLYRVILGRRALAGRAAVDPSRSYTTGAPKQRGARA